MQSSAFLWAQQEVVLLSCVGLECKCVSVKQSHLYRINSHKWLYPNGSTWAGQRREGQDTLSMIDSAALHAHIHTVCTTLMQIQ